MPNDRLAKIVSDLTGMLDGTYSPPPRPQIDVTTDALFGGLARVALHCEAVELLPGLQLRQTYAHMFSAPMVAFAPPPSPRAAHPAPWHHAEGGGLAENVTVEVYLEKGASPIGLPRLETIRLVATLVRLLAAKPACMPIISNVSFGAVTAANSPPSIRALEPVPNWPVRDVAISATFVELLQQFLQPAGTLLQDDDVFRAFSLADGMWWLPSWTAQMIAIWTAAETLMRPGRVRTGAALASGIRAYIGLSREHGDRLYNEVTRLYAARGGATHAGRQPSGKDLEASYRIVRDILLRCIAEGRRPQPSREITPLWTR